MGMICVLYISSIHMANLPFSCHPGSYILFCPLRVHPCALCACVCALYIMTCMCDNVGHEHVETCMWRLEVNVKYLPQLLSMFVFEAGSCIEPGAHQLINLLYRATCTVSPRIYLSFPRITMIAYSRHHGCHLASLVLGIALRSHDCTAGASPTEAVSHPSVHLFRGELSEYLEVYKYHPLHLSFFELCLKNCHLASFFPLFEFLSKLFFRKWSSGQKNVWRPLLRWLMKAMWVLYLWSGKFTHSKWVGTLIKDSIEPMMTGSIDLF